MWVEKLEEGPEKIERRQNERNCVAPGVVSRCALLAQGSSAIYNFEGEGRLLERQLGEALRAQLCRISRGGGRQNVIDGCQQLRRSLSGNVLAEFRLGEHLKFWALHEYIEAALRCHRFCSRCVRCTRDLAAAISIASGQVDL